MDKQAQAELRTATLLLSGFDGRLQQIEQRIDHVVRLVQGPSIQMSVGQAPPEPPRYREPGIPGILEMLEYAIRDAWNAKDWDKMIDLCNQYRELRNTL